MTLEKINQIAVKFNKNCSIAEGRYDEPKYVFAALLTLLEVLEENEQKKHMKQIEEALSHRD
jgi:hypothetical protein